jgi:SAM-dependent methyltransferase
VELGFTGDAFSYFYSLVESPPDKAGTLPGDLLELLGMGRTRDNRSFVQSSVIMPGKSYRPGDLARELSAQKGTKIFDPKHFSDQFGRHLSRTFMKMLVIIGISVLCLLLLFYVDLRLAAVTLLPVLFAFVCTLGTLKIIGRPLDIPALMIAIVIFGMGVDYSIYLVRAFQNYYDRKVKSLNLIGMSIFLAGLSTCIGFGVLAFAEHALLKSVGITSLLGVGFSLAGAYILLPPLLKRIFAPDAPVKREPAEPGSREHVRRVRRRYRNMPAYPRLFARFKMIFDPMFSELHRLVRSPGMVLDIGTGYAVPAAYLLELFPEMRIVCVEPDENRADIASRVLGESGKVITMAAPELPGLPGEADHVFMLDMMHYLDDPALSRTLEGAYNALDRQGKLIIRVMIPSGKEMPWERWLEKVRAFFRKMSLYYRTEKEIAGLLQEKGFTVTMSRPTSPGREETWIIGKKRN